LLSVELLSYADNVDDDKAARHYFEDLEQANGASSSSVTLACEIPAQEAPELERVEFRGFVRGKQTVSKFKETACNEIDVFLAVFRLPEIQTDILVTLCAPIAIAPESSSATTVRLLLLLLLLLCGVGS
jgi:hypothetical protein